VGALPQPRTPPLLLLLRLLQHLLPPQHLPLPLQQAMALQQRQSRPRLLRHPAWTT
jgi:hypothetical protein